MGGGVKMEEPSTKTHFGNSIFEDFILPEETDLSEERAQWIMAQVVSFNFILQNQDDTWN